MEEEYPSEFLTHVVVDSVLDGDDPLSGRNYCYDFEIEMGIKPQQEGDATSYHPISLTNVRAMYWSFEELVKHHASNGCNLQTGDLLGSGTLSMIPREEEEGGKTDILSTLGCFQELTYEGRVPITVNNFARLYLQDFDTCVFKPKNIEELENLYECATQIMP